MTRSADRTATPVMAAGAAEAAKNPWLALFALGLGFFMILLDTTIVNVAVPSISEALDSSLEQILWVLNAYVLVYAVLLITGGRLGDLFGLRNIFFIGLVIFTVGSATCAAAQDSTQLIVSRAVQGVGGALLTPQTLAVLTTIFAPERRATALGVWGAIAGIAAVTGPTLGGFLVTNFSWRSIFFVNVPIGLAALVATALLVPDIRPHRRQSMDLVGVILATVGLLGIVYGLIEGQRYQWGPVWGPVTIPEIIVSGFAVLVAFGVWERTRTEPLLPWPVLRNRTFVIMNGVGAAISFAVIGTFLPLVIYLQSALGMTALEAGLTIAPLPLASMVAAPTAGRLADRFGPKYVLFVGLLLYSLGMGLVIWIASPAAARVTFILPLIVAGLGNGCVYGPAAAMAMREVPRQLAGGASGLYNTSRQLGSVLGTAIVGAVLQNRLADLGSARFAVSADIATAVQQVGTRVFVDAMRPTLAVPVAIVALAAISCLAVKAPRMLRTG
jgi:EmrB/QacA subfamily drug resistance transporter